MFDLEWKVKYSNNLCFQSRFYVKNQPKISQIFLSSFFNEKYKERRTSLLLKMGQNFDLRVSDYLNPENILMGTFIDQSLAYSPLNSAKLTCSSEVTLRFKQRFQEMLEVKVSKYCSLWDCSSLQKCFLSLLVDSDLSKYSVFHNHIAPLIFLEIKSIIKIESHPCYSINLWLI